MVSGVWILSGGLCAAEAAVQAVDGPRFYEQRILPVLEKQCLMCHRGEARKGGLDMTSREALLKGGDNGPAIQPGKAKDSLLYKLVAHEQEPTMPYRMDRLPKETVALFAEWIDAGAPFDKPVASVNPPVGTSGVGPSLFTEKVKPVLEKQCLSCHGGKFKQAGLSILTRETLLRGSDNGPVVIAGQADASLLIKKVRHEHEPAMPYKAAKLKDDEIDSLTAWINAGASYEGSLQMTAGATKVVSLQDAQHWAFQPPKQASLPKVRNQRWVRNPIDTFVLAELEKKGLQPLGEADKRTLLRRVYLDLIGLPPKPEEINRFLADRSTDAYEQVVDQLLASPRYGERWGRHWMDIWRYSDPVSIFIGGMPRVDYSQFDIWNWRDWIIESLNDDKGYDRMVTEMLAGDELAPSDPKISRATGYLARSWYRFNRNVWLQDIVEYTSAGLLGVTMRCARCHDHKYDPIAQEEYYKLRAFFEPYDIRTDQVPDQPQMTEYHGLLKNGIPRAFDGEPREATKEAPFLPALFATTYRFIRGDEKTPDLEHPLEPGVPEALGGPPIQIQSVELPIEVSYPALRPFVGTDLLKKAESDLQKAEAAVARAQKMRAEVKEQLRLRNLSAGIGSADVHATPSRSETVAPVMEISFEKEIRPLLEKNCFSCHKSAASQSGLVLEAIETILEGGHINGPAIIPRKSASSPLLQYVRGEKKPRMPMGQPPLPESQIQLIARWIDQMPEDEPSVALRKAETALTLAEKKLTWARAYLPALQARIAADRAKYAEPPDPKASSLAQEAQRLERYANLLKAEENIFKAQQKLSEALTASAPSNSMEDKLRDKRVSTAKKELEAAQAELSKSIETYTPIGKLYPRKSTGRRLALARWIANSENPLTARVAVNHMWARHFGNFLVSTPSNFGISGKPPSHPELLDWLAVSLMSSQWKMKPLHRLMVTSSTYRSQSTAPTGHPGLKIDAENRYFWRANPQRMEAEVVRDSLLHLAGELDLTMGGPDLDPEKDDLILRRSLYFRHSVDARSEFLKVFNAANPEECYERPESIVPQQALALTNSALSYREARVLTRKLSQPESKIDDRAFIQASFETVLGRPPAVQELRKSERFINRQATLFSAKLKNDAASQTLAGHDVQPSVDPHRRARESFVHAMLSHNDFVTIR
jgi:mono/diheme cytochrome c family protein